MEERFSREYLVRSEHYADTMNRTVLPYLAEQRKEITVSGAGGKPIVCDRYDTENAKGTVTVLHGFTECAAKLSEVIYSLIRNGYSVLAYDQRGHGRSWRDERITDLSLTHVERFQDYVEDLEHICRQVLSDMPKPRYLFSHSMGGAVSALFLEDHPGVFEKAAFCAPMIAPRRGGLPLMAGKAMCWGAKMLGQARRRIPMSQPWSGPEVFENACASGKERFEWYNALRDRTDIFHNNGPTFSWALEAFNVTAKILAPGKPEGIRIPVRIYAAEKETEVLPEEQKLFADRLPNGILKVVQGAKHEIYRSPDTVLFPWWADVLQFFGGKS